jgi:hypothetical protein
MLEHHLATNSPLANLEDTDDVKFFDDYYNGPCRT